MGAGEFGREGDLFAFFPLHGGNDGNVIGQIQGGFEGFRQPVLQVAAYLETVHHHFDGVFLVLFQVGRVIHVVDAAIHAYADKALGPQFFKQVQVLTFLFANHRRQQHQFAAFFHVQNLVHHLADGLGGQRAVVFRAAGLADTCKQQPEVIVDFGDGAHGGARVVAGGFLLDGNGRAKPLDVVHIGFFHHRQKLTGVGGKGLHVTALALGIEGVEGQRGFARPGQTGNYHQLVPGDIQVHVFQVMGACATNQNGIHQLPLSTVKMNRAV